MRANASNENFLRKGFAPILALLVAGFVVAGFQAPAFAAEDELPAVLEEELGAPAAEVQAESAAEEEAADEGMAEEGEDEEEDTSEVLKGGSRLERGGSPLGVLAVESNPPGVKVFIDGEERGITPLEIKNLSDTAHEVILYHPDHGTFNQMVESGSGRIFVDLKKEAGMGVGFIDIETSPKDVRVDLDGKRVGLSPLKLPVVAGRHTVLLSREGYVDLEVGVQVTAGETALVQQTLAEKEGALLIITSPSGAEVFLDGESVGFAVGPLRLAKVQPGNHTLRIDKPGFGVWERKNVLIEREKTETILAALHPSSNECNVRLYSDPEGARVWLDGKEIGVSGPDGVGVNTTKGAHILRLEINPAIRPGFRPLQTSISFTEDMVDFKDKPIKLPVIDEAFLSAQKLFERGEGEQAIAFLDRVDPTRSSYPESRIMMVDVLKDLRRFGEIPGEFEKLFAQPAYLKNPVLNLAMGYWAVQAARQASDTDAAKLLEKAMEALDRCNESVDYFPAEERQVLALKANYYIGVAAELLFGLTGEKRHVKKGVQAWEMFFARLGASDETLGNDWVDRAKKHQRNLLFLEKKLGG